MNSESKAWVRDGWCFSWGLNLKFVLGLTDRLRQTIPYSNLQYFLNYIDDLNFQVP